MKIAVTYDTDGNVFQHFGHTEYFKVYTIENNNITASEVVSTNGQGHSALSVILTDLGVSALICGGIGGGARNMLSAASIELYPGVSGNADESVKALLAGTLSYDPDTVCSHHGADHVCH